MFSPSASQASHGGQVPSSSVSVLTAGQQCTEEQIKVVVRLRPNTEAGTMNLARAAGPHLLELQPEESSNQNVSEQYNFSYVASPSISQSRLFKICGKQLVDTCLHGFNGALLAYGQTGSGKTYTMLGPSAEDARSTGSRNSETWGMVPRALQYLFERLHASGGMPAGGSVHTTPVGRASHDPSSATSATAACTWLVKLSAAEIYQEVCSDLLAAAAPSAQHVAASFAPGGTMAAVAAAQASSNRVFVKEDIVRGVYMDGLSEHVVVSVEGAMKLVSRAAVTRHTAATRMNRESSRSHCILMLTIEQRGPTDGMGGSARRSVVPARGGPLAAGGAQGLQAVKRSRLYLVDLAGSERVKVSGAQGDRLKEAGAINRSLSTLELVILRLVEAEKSGRACDHIPYRDSKLTHILQCALGGNALTTLVACINPSSAFRAETQRTLGFAMRAKAVCNRAVVNETHEGDALALAAEVAKLQRENAALRMVAGKAAAGGPTAGPRASLRMGGGQESGNRAAVVPPALLLAKLNDVLKINGELEEGQVALRTQAAALQAERDMLQHQLAALQSEKAALEGALQDEQAAKAAANVLVLAADARAAAAEERAAAEARTAAAAQQAAEARAWVEACKTPSVSHAVRDAERRVAEVVARAEALQVQVSEQRARAEAAEARAKAGEARMAQLQQLGAVAKRVIAACVIPQLKQSVQVGSMPASLRESLAGEEEQGMTAQLHMSLSGQGQGQHVGVESTMPELQVRKTLTPRGTLSPRGGSSGGGSSDDAVLRASDQQKGRLRLPPTGALPAPTAGTHNVSGMVPQVQRHSGGAGLEHSEGGHAPLLPHSHEDSSDESSSVDGERGGASHTEVATGGEAQDSYCTTSTSTSGYTHMPGESLASFSYGRALPLPYTSSSGEKLGSGEGSSVRSSGSSGIGVGQHTSCSSDGLMRVSLPMPTSHVLASAMTGGTPRQGTPTSGAAVCSRRASCEQAVLSILQAATPVSGAAVSGTSGAVVPSVSRYATDDEATTISGGSLLSGGTRTRASLDRSGTQLDVRLSGGGAAGTLAAATAATLSSTVASSISLSGTAAAAEGGGWAHSVAGTPGTAGSVCHSCGGSNAPAQERGALLHGAGGDASTTPGMGSTMRPHPLHLLQQDGHMPSLTPSPTGHAAPLLGTGPSGPTPAHRFSFTNASLDSTFSLAESAFSLTSSMAAAGTLALRRSAMLSPAAAAAIGGATPNRSFGGQGAGGLSNPWSLSSAAARRSLSMHRTSAAVSPQVQAQAHGRLGGSGAPSPLPPLPPVPWPSAHSEVHTEASRVAGVVATHEAAPPSVAVGTPGCLGAEPSARSGVGVGSSPLGALRLSLQSLPLLQARALSQSGHRGTGGGASSGHPSLAGSPMPTARLWVEQSSGGAPTPARSPSPPTPSPPSLDQQQAQAHPPLTPTTPAAPRDHHDSQGGAVPGTAVAGPTVLRAKVAALQQEVRTQAESHTFDQDMLSGELGRRLQVEGALRTQLEQAGQEARTLAGQVEQLLAANDALGSENAARSERIAELEDALSRLFYQLRALTASSGAAGGVRASGALSGALITAVGLGSSMSASPLLASLDLASPASPRSSAAGAEAKMGRLLEVVAGQMRGLSSYNANLEVALQAAQSKLVGMEDVAARLRASREAVANGDRSGAGWGLGEQAEAWYLGQLEARDQAMGALHEQLAGAEYALQEAQVTLQLYERQASDLALQQTQWSVEVQRTHAAATAQAARDGARVRDLEAALVSLHERLGQVEEALNTERMRVAAAHAAAAVAEAGLKAAEGAAREREEAAAAAQAAAEAAIAAAALRASTETGVSTGDEEAGGGTEEGRGGWVRGGSAGARGCGGVTHRSGSAGAHTHRSNGSGSRAVGHTHTPRFLKKGAGRLPASPLPLFHSIKPAPAKGTWAQRWLTKQPGGQVIARGQLGVAGSSGVMVGECHKPASVAVLVSAAKRPRGKAYVVVARRTVVGCGDGPSQAGGGHTTRTVLPEPMPMDGLKFA